MTNMYLELAPIEYSASFNGPSGCFFRFPAS